MRPADGVCKVVEFGIVETASNSPIQRVLKKTLSSRTAANTGSSRPRPAARPVRRWRTGCPLYAAARPRPTGRLSGRDLQAIGRIRTRFPPLTMSRTAHPRQTGSDRRGRRLGPRAKQSSRRRKVALHNRQRPHPSSRPHTLRYDRIAPLGARPDSAVVVRWWSEEYPAQLARASLPRLCAVQISAHSAFTLSMPRNRNCLNPFACLICPNTGSTTCFLSL